ncbi:hypothetical protein SNOG_07915 [Parastagonospora nodorum SN15]|uniref:Uncharacterized protein n=1 Tax=Phaeosphaeria nodorum (strain SN15 / ATCC MYA-4574 / FGSC 10173) TaxID=321614 RepID=Q0UJZ9_PHANO|nr:hypothetical protein SNOG_07915 [Parastagonospora nodorum SN15]EAT84191.2 hypothetical protein SNOG_07915 [Parastagonospora nodorum SN15]
MGFGASPFTTGGSSSALWKNHSITLKLPSSAPTPSTSTPCLRNPSGPRARRSHASPGSRLPPSPAAPSSLPRPFAQPIWYRTCTSASSRPTRSRKSRPRTPRALSRSSASRPRPHLPRSRTLRVSSSRTRRSRSRLRALQARRARRCRQRTGSRRRKSRPPLPLTKRSDAGLRPLYQNTSDCVNIEQQ